MSRSPEVSANPSNTFIATAGVVAGSHDLLSRWQELRTMPESVVHAGPEISIDTYITHINQFVVETTRVTQSQQQYLAFMQARMKPDVAAGIEAEIARSSEANTETLGRAWMDLQARGYWLRTRHPETGQVAYVGGIGLDEHNRYQTMISEYEEPWPLISGTQLHV